MKTINRAAIVINPRQPLIDWLNGIDDSDHTLSLDEVRRDSTTYLIPDIEDEHELDSFLQRNYLLVFEEELAGWISDEELWPKSRNFKTFLEWFGIEFHSIVVDLCE